MKYSEIKIGMEVGSIHNSFTTYIVRAKKDGKVDVEYVEDKCRGYNSNGNQRYYDRSPNIFFPIVKEKKPRNLLVAKITKILEGGTKIVSFTYDGKRRNVLLGSEVAADYPNWGVKVNPILTVHNGKAYISGVDNLDGRMVKTFEVSKIRNPSF